MRRTIAASDNPSVLGGVRAKNNGRYNGNGRHWATPPEIFDPLHAEFDFTLDPCATPATAKCANFFTEGQNGLEQSWAGHRVFMNPPYGKEVYAWTRKARLEQSAGVLVVGLLPASTDLSWWHEDVVEYAEVRYLRGRVRFLTDGPYRASGFFASVIVIWKPMPLDEDPSGQRREPMSPHPLDDAEPFTSPLSRPQSPGKVCGYHDGCPPDGLVCHLCEHLQP